MNASNLPVLIAVIAIGTGLAALVLVTVLRAHSTKAALRPLSGTPVRYFPGPHVDESRLRVATLLAIQALRPRWGDRIEPALTGLPVRVMPSMKWRNGAGEWVGGEIAVEAGGIVVARVCVDLSSLAHEFLHVLLSRLDGVTDSGHTQWADLGVWTLDEQFRNKLAEVPG